MTSAHPSVPVASPRRVGGGLLAGRVALVTGAGRNIGRAIALRCGREGAKVAVNDVDAASVQSVVEELAGLGAVAYPAPADVSDFGEVDDLFTAVESELGVVDVLVNNAYVRRGATSFGPFLHLEPADWTDVVARNMAVLFACTQRAARALAAGARGGAIVNISSHGAERAHRNHIPYDSVKGAMDSFTRAVAVDLAPWGIRVNGLRPGTIEVDDDPIDWGVVADLRAAQVPLGRVGSPAEIAACVAFLASDQAAYVTGQTFNADGGLLAQGRPRQAEAVPVATPGTIGHVRRSLGVSHAADGG